MHRHEQDDSLWRESSRDAGRKVGPGENQGERNSLSTGVCTKFESRSLNTVKIDLDRIYTQVDKDMALRPE